jgi:hypothetical protein
VHMYMPERKKSYNESMTHTTKAFDKG